jgi:hypothetical protein
MFRVFRGGSQRSNRNTRNQNPGRRSRRETLGFQDGALEDEESAMQRKIYRLSTKETKAVVGGARLFEPSPYRVRYTAPPAPTI